MFGQTRSCHRVPTSRHAGLKRRRATQAPRSRQVESLQSVVGKESNRCAVWRPEGRHAASVPGSCLSSARSTDRTQSAVSSSPLVRCTRLAGHPATGRESCYVRSPPTAGAHVTPAGGLTDTSTGPRSATGALSRAGEEGGAFPRDAASAAAAAGFSRAGGIAVPWRLTTRIATTLARVTPATNASTAIERCSPPCRRSDGVVDDGSRGLRCRFGTSCQQVFDFESRVGDVRQTSRTIFLEAAPQQLADLRRRRGRQD